MDTKNFTDQLKEIYSSDLEDLEKMTRAFGLITETILMHSNYEIEMRRALNDHENLIKEQIKNNTVKHLRDVFNTCHQQISGKKAWNE